MWESWKGLKCHGWGLHGGTWKMGAWGWNIVFETFHVLVGDMFQGLRLSRHWNTCWAAHQNLTCSVLVCFGSHDARAWKPALGRLKANNTFTICQGHDVHMPKKDP
jgi:hypothetical protein